MTLVQQLCKVATAYMDARKRSVSRVSTLVFGDGTKLSGLIEGKTDLTTSRFEAAMGWFSKHWPDGVEWPEQVDRPTEKAAA